MATKFSEALAHRICELAGQGKTDQEIADETGISRQTLFNWRGKYKTFDEAMAAGKSIADGLVEASLFQRACGYSHPAVKIFYNSKDGSIVKEEYIERYPPDTVAAIFWLKNRNPKRWKDRREITGADGGPLSLEQLVGGSMKKDEGK